MRYGVLSAAIGLGLAMATPAQATTLLTSVTDYNAFVLGSYAAPYGDVEGRLAVGGSAQFTSFGVAQTNTPLGDTYTLVVGGALSFNNGQIHQGSALVGGAVSTSGFGIPHGSVVRQNPTGLDFAGEGARLTALASTLAGRTANGTSASAYGTTTFSGLDAGLNVFTISAAALSNQNVVVKGPVGSSALINVVGGDASFLYKGFSLVDIDASNVLFNFADASVLTLNGVGVHGSVLAPKARLDFTNGQINGLVVAGAINGPGQINYRPYTGGLLDPAPLGVVPEPATWGLMIGGFGLVGGVLRRRGRALATA